MPTKPKPAPLVLKSPAPPATLAGSARAANRAAARAIFADHLARKSANTVKRTREDLATFERFLQLTTGRPARGDLIADPGAWRGLSWGIVAAFRAWLLGEGYALATVNAKLSTVRIFATLAGQAGALGEIDLLKIQKVRGYARREFKALDEKRSAAEVRTRQGAKKAAAVRLSDEQAAALIAQPETDQGKRDRLLMCLLLQHGLRIGEIVLLTARSFDLGANQFTVYRPKVRGTKHERQTHEMTRETRAAWRAYMDLAPARGPIWRKSNKRGGLARPMSESGAARTLRERVRILGARLGIDHLSPHDARHFWATFEARMRTPIDRLMQAGGWNSPAMPLQYIEAAAIANAGTARVKKVRR